MTKSPQISAPTNSGLKISSTANADVGARIQVLSYAALGLIAVVTLAASTYQIPPGHVGVVYEFGAIRGQIAEGLQFIAPWRSVRLANIQVQRHVFDKLNAFSEGALNWIPEY